VCSQQQGALKAQYVCEQTCRLFNKTCATVLNIFELRIELCMACYKAVSKQQARLEVFGMQVQVRVLQMMDMSAYAIVASEVAYLAAQWNELPALQTLESEGSKLTCAACSDN